MIEEFCEINGDFIIPYNFAPAKQRGEFGNEVLPGGHNRFERRFNKYVMTLRTLTAGCIKEMLTWLEQHSS
jgi:hypothetical protein